MLDPFFSVGDGLDGVRVGIAALSLAASVAYFGFMQRARSAHRTLAKTICFSFLSFLPLTYLPVFPDELAGLIALSLALVLSAIGDMFLAVGDEHGRSEVAPPNHGLLLVDTIVLGELGLILF